MVSRRAHLHCVAGSGCLELASSPALPWLLAAAATLSPRLVHARRVCLAVTARLIRVDGKCLEGATVTVASAEFVRKDLWMPLGRGRGFALPEPRREFSNFASSFGFAQPCASL